MRVFATQLKGKTIMSSGGERIGEVDNIVVDTRSGALVHLLAMPSPEVDPRLFKTDSDGRLVLPFSDVKSVKDVVVIELK